jgi:uncharacterized phage-associated protein
MENARNVAKWFYERYYEMWGNYPKQGTLQKLLYFAQKESFVYKDEKLFEEKLLAYETGPGLSCVAEEYEKETPFAEDKGAVSDETRALLRLVLQEFGYLSGFKLSSLAHSFAWKRARTSEAPGISDAALKVDVVKEMSEKGMFYDDYYEDLWDELGAEPVDEDKDGRLLLADDWYIFPKGTDTLTIWHWFDEKHSKGVGWLMNEREERTSEHGPS